jgi:uncharacterized membrane protein (UPF0127 family)
MANWIVPRFFGLMGKPGLAKGKGIWFVPCNSIHSFFMRFEFDAIFVDRDGVVLHLIESMPAWRLSPLVRKCRAVIELPAGTIQATGTQLGDTLQIQS